MNEIHISGAITTRLPQGSPGLYFEDESKQGTDRKLGTLGSSFVAV